MDTDVDIDHYKDYNIDINKESLAHLKSLHHLISILNEVDSQTEQNQTHYQSSMHIEWKIELLEYLLLNLCTIC